MEEVLALHARHPGLHGAGAREAHEGHGFLIVSAHREETSTPAENLVDFLDALRALAETLPVPGDRLDPSAHAQAAEAPGQIAGSRL